MTRRAFIIQKITVNQMGKKLRIAELVFAVAGGTVFFLSWIMNFWLWKAMPTQPDIGRGFTIPMINHGRTIYLTPLYNIVYSTLFWGGLTLFLLAVLIDFYKDPFNWRAMRML